MRQKISDEVWEHNYRAPGEKTVEDTWKRVASHCASVEKEEIREKVYNDFLWLLTDFKGLAGGRITANIGIDSREATTLYNCFVSHPSDLDVQDPDSIEGIYDMLRRQAHTLKSEGGYGTNFSYIRPSGAYVVGIGNRTPGVLAFMKLWNDSSAIITMGSEKNKDKQKIDEKNKIRKGAQMACLSSWHPDIEEFIDAKLVPGRFDKFNLSVGITQGFMETLLADGDWNLRFPDTTHPLYKSLWRGDIYDWEARGLPVVIYKTVKASYLWDKIMKATYTRNDPGVLFLDLFNKYNSLSYTETIHTTNPCFHGDERFLTNAGYIKFKDSQKAQQEHVLLVDNRISYNDVSPDEKLENWVIDVTKKGSSLKPSSAAFITQDYAELLELEFFNGQTLRCTPDHHIATDSGMVEAQFLTQEHKILVSKVSPPTISIFTKTRKDRAKSAPMTKSESVFLEMGRSLAPVTETVFNNARTRIGLYYLSGVFSHAEIHNTGNKVNISMASSDISFLRDIQLLLHANGIISFIFPEASVGLATDRPLPSSYRLVTDDWSGFAAFGFADEKKNQKLIQLLNSIPSYNDEDVFTHLKSRTPIDGDVVYCIKEPDTRSVIVNSISARRCGEIGMGTGVCLLFSLNLTKFVKDDRFDFETFKKAVEIATRFADNINDISRTPLDEYLKSAKTKRRIGLGVLGLGSLHYMLGIKYGSNESLKLIDDIFKLKNETELLTSAKLGKEKDSFELFDPEAYFSTEYWKTLPISAEVKRQIEEIGEMRNSHHGANAPTGNMSVYAGVVSNGIEPLFMKEYVRWMIVTESERAELRSQGFVFPDVHKEEWFETKHLKFSKVGTDDVLVGEFGGEKYQVDKNRGLTRANNVEDYGWQYVKQNFSEDKIAQLTANGVFCTSDTLSVDDHINVLKVVAKYTNMNSSKTVNIPNNYSYEDFKDLYLSAWESGIKGITSYRAGTMMAVLEAPKTEEVQKAEAAQEETNRFVKKRPRTLDSETHKIKVDFGDGNTRNAYVTVSFFPETKRPYEVLVIAPYFGLGEKDLQILELTARMTSMSLRHGMPIQFVCEQLDKIGGQYIFSVPTNVARILRNYISEEPEDMIEVVASANVAKCPKCGVRAYRITGTCGTCDSCGYYGCG